VSRKKLVPFTGKAPVDRKRSLDGIHLLLSGMAQGIIDIVAVEISRNRQNLTRPEPFRISNLITIGTIDNRPEIGIIVYLSPAGYLR
jgi:hypothetical protein